jgi:hypothetical protein
VNERDQRATPSPSAAADHAEGEDNTPDPPDRPEAPEADQRIAQLREMGEESEHLDDVVEDARVAVQAARQAGSMRSAGTEGGTADEQGPQPSGSSATP